MSVVAWVALVAAGGCLLWLALQAYAVRRLRAQLESCSQDLGRVSAELVRLREEAPPQGAVHSVPASVVQPVGAGTAGGAVPMIMSPLDEVDLSGSRVASVTLAGPLLKVAAFPYGVRRAMNDERRMLIRHAMRKELRRQRKLRRRRRAGRGPSEGWSG